MATGAIGTARCFDLGEIESVLGATSETEPSRCEAQFDEKGKLERLRSPAGGGPTTLA
jgi:hypothetical protein